MLVDLPDDVRPTSNAARGIQTRAHVLSVVIPLIAQRGSRGISLKDLAAAAGVSKTNLLHHFGSKEGLLTAALDWRDEIDRYPAGLAGHTAFEVLDMIERSIDDWSRRPESIGVFTVLLGENLNDGDPLHDRLVERSEVVRAAWADAIRRSQASGEVRTDVDAALVAIEFSAFLNGLETGFLLEPQLPYREAAHAWVAGMRARLGAGA